MLNKLNQYSRQGLWSLFLMCAFPIHLWALLMIFNDVGWVSKRTNSWDAAGLASYGMVIAFFESVIFFIVITLLGFLVSPKWDKDRRLALMSALALILSLWGMISQLFFLLGVSFSPRWLLPLTQMNHPVRLLYLIALILTMPTIILPTYVILFKDKAVRFMLDVIERISLLAAVYLFFDTVGLIIVIIRNI